MGLSCVQVWSTTEKTVSSKVQTAEQDNEYESNEYIGLIVERLYTN